MRWAKSEYILKGVFLGLLLFVSLQKDLDWYATGRVALWLVGGFLVALVIAAIRQFRDIKGLGRNPLGFLLFLLLENPLLIYAGIIFGLAGAAIDLVGTKLTLLGLEWDSENRPLEMSILGYCVLGGALFGYGLGELRQITNPLYRLGITAILCAAVGVVLYYWLDDLNLLGDERQRMLLGVHLLLGIPFFYLLVFCGMAEESEVEIAALCVTLGLGMYLVKFPDKMPALGLLLPVGLYCVYTIRILRPLRVFKHALRGIGHAEVGRVKDALAAFNRALQLDPKHQLARHGLVRLHRGLSLDRLDADTRSLLNPNLVVSEAANLLIAGTPSAAQLKEANDLLSFVEGQWPQLKPTIRLLQGRRRHARPEAGRGRRAAGQPARPGGLAGRRQVPRLGPVRRLATCLAYAPRAEAPCRRRAAPAAGPAGGGLASDRTATCAVARRRGRARVSAGAVRRADGRRVRRGRGRRSAAGLPVRLRRRSRACRCWTQPDQWRRGALLVRIAAHGQAGTRARPVPEARRGRREARRRGRGAAATASAPASSARRSARPICPRIRRRSTSPSSRSSARRRPRPRTGRRRSTTTRSTPSPRGAARRRFGTWRRCTRTTARCWRPSS